MSRPLTTSKSSLAATCAALILLLIAAVSAGAAEVVVHYTKESPAEFEQQLSRGEIAAATLNKKVRSIRLTLKDGRHVLVKYAKRQSAAEAAKLKAHHVTVTVLTPVQANKELKAAPKHHRIRYIVAAVLVVVILLIGAVFLIRRRRERD
jgi:hypothetical protein